MFIGSVDNISTYTKSETYTETKKTEPVEKKSDSGISFGDILDIVNPLQHIPIVSTIYRSATGDAISPVSRLIGGTIFGKIFGLVSAVVNIVVEAVTGKDIGDHVMTAIKGKPNTTHRSAMREDKNNYTGKIFDASNRIHESDEFKPVIYSSREMQRYAEVEGILESKNYHTANTASIIV